MVLMELPEAINAYPLLVIKAEKVQLLSMETAIDWDRFLLVAHLENWRYVTLLFLGLRHVVLVQVQIINLVIDIHVLLIHVLLVQVVIERVASVPVSKY